MRLVHGVGGAPFFIFFGTSEVELLNQPVPGGGVFISPVKPIFAGSLSSTGEAFVDLTPRILVVPGLTIQLRPFY